MPNSKWTWAPAKKTEIPIEKKIKTDSEMNDLINNTLRKKYVKPPPHDSELNYIVDFYTKQRRQYFYLCAKYHARSKNRLVDYFEVKFARLEYTLSGYTLAYMRHTGKWRELYSDLTLKEAIEHIRREPHFEP